jgi:hypothetical protein
VVRCGTRTFGRAGSGPSSDVRSPSRRPPSGHDTTVKSPARAEWTVIALLIVLSVVPLVAGAFRLGELATGAPVTAA